MAIETQTSREVGLIEQAIDRFADEHQWKSDDYEVYIAPNEDWERYFVALKCSRFGPEDERAYNKQIFSYLGNALREWPRLIDSIDLDVISLNGPFGHLKFR